MVSTLHTALSASKALEMPRVRFPWEGLTALRTAATAFGNRLAADIQHRWTMRTLDRFSDHRLRDLGFERDWDGTVIPIIDGR